MKRPLPLVILFIVLFNLTGYFLLFGGLELRVKKYASGLKGQSELTVQPTIIRLPKVNSSETVSRSISATTSEFRWNGAMYDVLKRVITKDSLIFYCFEDKNETELISCFLQYLSQNTATGDHEQDKFLLKKIVNFYFEGVSPFSTYLQASEFRYKQYFIGYAQMFSTTAAKPPDLT
ncbi:MAG: hypothetical protein ABIO46_04750 [Chitinophagales bacterium]